RHARHGARQRPSAARSLPARDLRAAKVADGRLRHDRARRADPDGPGGRVRNRERRRSELHGGGEDPEGAGAEALMNVGEMTVNGRTYRRPARPVVVVCLDGSALEYIDGAIAAGVAPYLRSLSEAASFRLVESALPSFTNPNNVSIVTGVPPSVHGISGNFFLDRATGKTVMMNDASFLRAETILAAFSRGGARVAVVTAKDKLRRLLGHGVTGTCVSIEAGGTEVYSAAL